MADLINSPPSLPPPTNWAERAALVAWGILLFSVCLALGTRHHKFPYYYHPDEPGKAEQVITGRFNFNHPLLLLGTVRLATDVLHVPKDSQAVVETGRCVSAGFMAAGIVMLSLVAYLWRGWRAAIISGVGLLLHHQLYELSHYLKEDSALLFGIGCTMLAGMAYAQRASVWRAAVLGVSCALAISGKYIGVLMLGVALPVLWYGAKRAAAGAGSELPGPRPLGKLEHRIGAHLGAFVVALVLVFAIINLTLLFNLATFGHSFGREVNLAATGQGDSTRTIPHALYWNVFLDNSTPAIWVLLIALVAVCVPRWARLTLFHKILISFPFAYGLLLSFSPKENDRYFLPATAVFTLLAAIGIEAMPLLLNTISRSLGNKRTPFLQPRIRRVIYVVCAVLFLVLQVTGWSSTKPGWALYDAAFVHDDIATLIQWMKTQLPPKALVVADGRAGVPNTKRKEYTQFAGIVPQRIVVSKFAADDDVPKTLFKNGYTTVKPEDVEPLSQMERLRAMGVTHVIISESSYGRFARNDLRPKHGTDERFMAAKSFYEGLLRNSDTLFQTDRGTVIYLHPGIRVYQLQGNAGE